MRAKSDTTKYVRRFLADMNGMGTPGCFCMDGGGEFTGWEFTEFCDAVDICREYTTPDMPKQNGVMDSAIWRAFNGSHASCHHFSNPLVDLSAIPQKYPDGHRLWLASTVWAPGCFNRSATKVNRRGRSPYEVFFGRKPPLKVVIFFLEGMMRVKRIFKSVFHDANTHSTSTALVLWADTGRVCHTNNVVWVAQGAAVMPVPVSTIWGGGGGGGVLRSPQSHLRQPPHF